MNTISEEQVLFNELSYENQQFILKQMRLLQPCKVEIRENKEWYNKAIKRNRKQN